MSITGAAISGVVAAAVRYLLESKGMAAAAQKAVEQVGLLSGEALVNAGKNALAKLRTALTERGAAAQKAQRALENVEQEPDEQAYQAKLTTELEKLAANDAQFRTLLEQLSAEFKLAGGSAAQGSVSISGGTQYGNQIGVNQAPISSTYTINDRDD